MSWDSRLTGERSRRSRRCVGSCLRRLHAQMQPHASSSARTAAALIATTSTPGSREQRALVFSSVAVGTPSSLLHLHADRAQRAGPSVTRTGVAAILADVCLMSSSLTTGPKLTAATTEPARSSTAVMSEDAVRPPE